MCLYVDYRCIQNAGWMTKCAFNTFFPFTLVEAYRCIADVAATIADQPIKLPDYSFLVISWLCVAITADIDWQPQQEEWNYTYLDISTIKHSVTYFFQVSMPGLPKALSARLLSFCEIVQAGCYSCQQLVLPWRHLWGFKTCTPSSFSRRNGSAYISNWPPRQTLLSMPQPTLTWTAVAASHWVTRDEMRIWCLI